MGVVSPFSESSVWERQCHASSPVLHQIHMRGDLICSGVQRRFQEEWGVGQV